MSRPLSSHSGSSSSSYNKTWSTEDRRRGRAQWHSAHELWRAVHPATHPPSPSLRHTRSLS
jgi:hypothetical protein